MQIEQTILQTIVLAWIIFKIANESLKYIIIFYEWNNFGKIIQPYK